jgi:hypothetical protein
MLFPAASTGGFGFFSSSSFLSSASTVKLTNA